MAGAKTVTAVVAPGRTVFSEAVKSTVWDVDAKRDVEVVKAAGQKGPGETVSLPEAEVKRLRALGFLLKEGVEPVETASAPMFNASEGPQIKVA